LTQSFWIACPYLPVLIHWSSVKEFFRLKAIDFVPEAYLKFWSIYMKSIPCSSLQQSQIFDNCCGDGGNLSRFFT